MKAYCCDMARTRVLDCAALIPDLNYCQRRMNDHRNWELTKRCVEYVRLSIQIKSTATADVWPYNPNAIIAGQSSTFPIVFAVSQNCSQKWFRSNDVNIHNCTQRQFGRHTICSTVCTTHWNNLSRETQQGGEQIAIRQTSTWGNKPAVWLIQIFLFGHHYIQTMCPFER